MHALVRCRECHPGLVDLATLALLEEKGFDQAPVKDATGRVVLGLVETQYLRGLAGRGEPLSARDPALQDDESWLRIGRSVTIDALLERMARRRAVIVVEESDSIEHGHSESDIGFLTISDLNRHTLRGALYSLMAHVEAEMAALVETTIPDAWVWIRGLNEGHQVTILGYWELSKRRGVDVGPVAATTLSQLLQVAARSKEVLARLGFESRKQFEDLTGRIPASATGSCTRCGHWSLTRRTWPRFGRLSRRYAPLRGECKNCRRSNDRPPAVRRPAAGGERSAKGADHADHVQHASP